MAENNNTDNSTNSNSNINNTNTNITNEQNAENIESDQIEIQMALPVSTTATYSSIPQIQTQTQTQTQTQNNFPTAHSLVEYIPPIYTINGQRNNTSQDIVTQEMVVVFQFGKSVKCISMIDMFFGFLHFIVSPYGFISFIFPLFGYKGATTYKKCFVDTYLGYQILYCFINVLILINILFNSNIELPEKQSVEMASFFQTITILFNLYFIRITGKFSNNLKSITPEQQTLLLMMNFENIGGIYL